MPGSLRLLRAAVGVAALLTSRPSEAAAQSNGNPKPRADSVDVVAGERYGAGSLHRFFLGSGYRELWTTQLRVPVLDLRTFAGGLRPYKLSGGNQTKGLRFEAPDGMQYVFRSVDKTGTSTPKVLKGTVVDAIVRDQVSTSHPGGAMIAARLLEAAGVLHVTPTLVVMPDDSLLGEFREDFAGLLGMIEEYPVMPSEGPGLGGAIAIIDSDTLLAMMNRDPRERIDTRAMLTARLMDLLMGDWDRHAGNWKWARKRSNPRTAWLPIPRDRDKVFISGGGGLLPSLARLTSASVVAFDSTYPSVRALSRNSLDFDRRVLLDLHPPAWDSIAAALQKRITDAVIDAAVLAGPKEYRVKAPELAAKLKVRRDSLRVVADEFYHLIVASADIHGTDANDRASITLVADGQVEVRLESGGTRYFNRRFDARETRDIRVYLHGGADTALVKGRVASMMPIRIIGGAGANHLLDSSRVDGKPGARLYDAGVGDDAKYGPDTTWNREPYVTEDGEVVHPGRSRGTQWRPVAGLRTNRELGFVPQFGFHHVRYGFGRRPYSRLVAADAEYATDVDAWRVGITVDQRYEETPVHFLGLARLSRLETISYYGLGNQSPGPDAGEANLTDFFDVEQQQWLLYPAVAVTLGRKSEVWLGPMVQYNVSDSTPNRYISAVRPYGFGKFGQAGMRLTLRHDVRDNPADPRKGVLFDFTGSVFPAVWDVESPFGSVKGSGRAYLTLPIPIHPILVFRGGAAKVFGQYPFHEAAYIGGPGNMRSLDAQRYAGDASVFGSVELRVPFGNFTALLPWNIGVFGVMDAGRVYVDGQSPGGWHSSRGIGFWIGLVGPTTAIRFCRRPGDSGPC